MPENVRQGRCGVSSTNTLAYFDTTSKDILQLCLQTLDDGGIDLQ
jgi:hypothetical protein